MVDGNAELRRRLLALFQEEAQDHLRTLREAVLELEQQPDPARRASALERVFRGAHSLKGAARTVNLPDVVAACQRLEELFARLKRGALSPTPALLDGFQAVLTLLPGLLPAAGVEATAASPEAVERVRAALAAVEQVGLAVGEAEPDVRIPSVGEPEPAPQAAASAPRREAASTAMERRPSGDGEGSPEARTASGSASSPTSGQVSSPSPSSATVSPQPDEKPIRMRTSALQHLLGQADELAGARALAAPRVDEARALRGTLTAWERRWASAAPGLRALLSALPEESSGGSAGGSPAELLEALDRGDELLRRARSGAATLASGLERDGSAFDRALDGLTEATRRALMVPFSAAFAGLALLLRDLARAQGKEAELTFEGTEVEVDRRVVEEMKDGFVHLVRNAVDHGVEAPAVREAQGKPRRGTVAVRVVAQPGGKVEVTVADDGAGIDAAGVRAAAVRQRLLAADDAQALDDAQAADVIFRSGLTTAPLVTDLSGRGLGLAIVREKAEKLGGTAEVRSTPGRGAVFRLVLPLTLSAFRGLVVRAGGEEFVLPLRAVERAIRVRPQDVVAVENRETVPYGERRAAVAWLTDLLGRPGGRRTDDAGASPAVVLAGGGEPLAVVVDEVVGEAPAVTKPLPHPLRRVRNVSGAAVLGGGRVALVLHPPDLRRSATGVSRSAATAAAPAARVRSVLVAEDSITSRTLLRNILESAGYRVRTTIDGAEALAELRAGEFDLLVTDLDMPRMDGFALTAAVRADRKLSALPVVLVTARESREDRERGIEAGANAYLVKSSFDQSNLLEVVARLL